MQTLIRAESLTKKFGDFTAVQSFSVEVQRGEVLALLGPNGAGKTTTIRMLSSILAPTSGRASVAGYDVSLSPEAVRASIGMLTEHHGLYTRMRAPEYLTFFGSMYAIPHGVLRERIDTLVSLYQLEDAMDRRLGEYSKGMRQKLALVRTLLHEPPVLLLDEPTSAMDPASARLVRKSISELRSSERAIVVCTHNLAEAEELADRIAIIHAGRIVAYGSAAELKSAYLGDPIMEIRTAASLNGVVDHLAGIVDAFEAGDNWVRYRATEPASTNPLVLEIFAQVGVPVVTLTEVGRSLEDVYLQVVGVSAADREAAF